MKPRVLVFGGSGQVGLELQRVFATQNVEAVFPTRLDADITDSDAVEAAFRNGTFTCAVNTAAYTDVDGAESEPQRADEVNARGARNVAAAAARRGMPVVHVSTDYVFDGNKGSPYVEDDPVCPVGAYGLSKEAGERFVRDANSAHVIVRTAWVFSPFGRNFVKTMLRVAAERQELKVVDDQRGTPTTAGDIARAIAVVTTRLSASPGTAELYGTFHFASGEATTWYRFANAIFEESKSRGGPWARLAPIRTDEYPTAAKRPADSRLNCKKIERVYGISPGMWCAGLCDTLDRLFADEGLAVGGAAAEQDRAVSQ